MKQVYLIRHAKAEKVFSGFSDFERTLSQKGIFDATRLGGALKQKKVHFDKLYFSPALRTTQTAELLQEQMSLSTGIMEEVPMIYNSSAASLYRFLCQLNDQENVVGIVGHNPALTHFLEFITCEEGIHFPTSGCVQVQFDVSGWEEIMQGLGEIKSMEGMG
ncbi:SixA phosphatase family protein [Algivirga pacifica]|uniref:Phosphohistidine phosphatase SixA n=1 Tax=Algivirga pacifica TaxID=1162670 RepID=A0ABP9DFI0_9BACT